MSPGRGAGEAGSRRHLPHGRAAPAGHPERVRGATTWRSSATRATMRTSSCRSCTSRSSSCTTASSSTFRADGAGTVDQRAHMCGAPAEFREAQRLAGTTSGCVFTDFLPKNPRRRHYESMVETTEHGGLITAQGEALAGSTRPRRSPYIPVEWSVGAYRFGHSQIRPMYNLDDVVSDLAVFIKTPKENNRLTHLVGAGNCQRSGPVDWRSSSTSRPRRMRPRPSRCPKANGMDHPRRHRNRTTPSASVSPSRRSDTALATGLQDLPGIDDASRFLAERNLSRGRARVAVPTTARRFDPPARSSPGASSGEVCVRDRPPGAVPRLLPSKRYSSVPLRRSSGEATREGHADAGSVGVTG